MDIKVRPEPAITALLRAARMSDACVIAARRLRASGLIPMSYSNGQTRFHHADWQSGGIDPIRLGAALLFPVSDRGISELAQMVVRPDNKHLPR